MVWPVISSNGSPSATEQVPECDGTLPAIGQGVVGAVVVVVVSCARQVFCTYCYAFFVSVKLTTFFTPSLKTHNFLVLKGKDASYVYFRCSI